MIPPDPGFIYPPEAVMGNPVTSPKQQQPPFETSLTVNSCERLHMTATCCTQLGSIYGVRQDFRKLSRRACGVQFKRTRMSVRASHAGTGTNQHQGRCQPTCKSSSMPSPPPPPPSPPPPPPPPPCPDPPLKPAPAASAIAGTGAGATTATRSAGAETICEMMKARCLKCASS